MRAIMRAGLVLGCMGCQEYSVQGKPEPDSEPTTPTETSPPETTPTLPDPSAPDIEVDPLTVDFGFWPPACTSSLQVITITNVGDAELEVTDIALDNTDGVYRIVATPGPLAPGESLAFEVDFTPADLAVYSASSVQVASNDPDEGVVGVGLLGEGADDGVFVDLFQQNEANTLDILWVIDNSGSMSNEIGNLADTFDTFINGFVVLGLDYQIGVVTTDMVDPAQSGRLQGAGIISPANPDPVGAFVDTVNTGSSGSGDERGLDAAYAALTAPLIGAENAGLVRPGSNVSVIVVTDEDDSSSINPGAFATWLDGYQGDPALASFSAVAGPKSGIFPCLALFSGVSASPAPTYWDAVRLSGGVHLSICDMDMTDILTELALVSSGLLDRFPLTFVPTVPADIEVRVDGVVIPHGEPNGVTYDAAANTIVLHGNSIPLPEQTVEVTYTTLAECPT